MIILLYGQDTYRSQAKLHELIDQYKKASQNGLDLRYFDMGRARFQDIKGELASRSMFREKKIFILCNLFSNPDAKEQFLKQAEDFLKTDDVFLIREEDETPSKDALFNLLKEKAEVWEFSLLDGPSLKKWAQKEAGKYGLKISALALERLMMACGNNLWQMVQELQKLAAFAISKKKNEIEEEDAVVLVKPKIEADIFKTIDAIASRNKKQALQLLHRHIEKGDSPIYLLSMINFQARNLLLVKDLMEKREPYQAIIKKTKLHPFVVRKSWSQAQRFDLEELKKICRKIFQADLDIKTGRVDPQLALDLLVLGA